MDINTGFSKIQNELSGNADKYMLLKNVPEHIPGLTEYRIRRMCKEGLVKHVRVGNRYVTRVSWVNEALNQMAEANLKKPEEAVQSYGVLRKVKG